MSISSIEIRQIQKSDDPKIKEIILNSLEEYGANREGFAAKDPELESLTDFYHKIGGIYFIATEKGELIGGAGIAPLKGDASVWELQKMYLKRSARGKGVGKKLIESCIQNAMSRKLDFLYIETLDSMKEANAMYQKYGFKKIDSPIGNTGHFGCDRYYLLNING
ncbi:MAG: GNAT family N-acetyltransferase [Crocinitomicaceae bacterium]|nr:GNAT family N-acetyltransferase [Crocinitomicaceae bacterium]